MARYLGDDENGEVSLLLPAEHSADAYDNRRSMRNVLELVSIDMECPACHAVSLKHLSVSTDAQGNGAGNTMKYGAKSLFLNLRSEKIQLKLV